jgi:hypothetical protein
MAAQTRGYLDALPIPGKLRLGDVNKLIPKLFELTRLSAPPQKLILGLDGVTLTRQQLKLVADDLAAYEAWSEDLLEPI